MKISVLSFFAFTYLCLSCTPTKSDKVSSPNLGSAPKAFNSTLKALRGNKIEFTAKLAQDSDSLKSRLSYKIIKAPSHGLVDDKCFLETETHSNRHCIYTPDENFVGRDSLTFQVIDENTNQSNLAYIDFFVVENENIEVVERNLSLETVDIDIILCIDSSKSMQAKIEELQDSILSFLNTFEQSTVNSRISILAAKDFEQLDHNKLLRDINGNIPQLTSENFNKDKNLFLFNFSQVLKSLPLFNDPGRLLASIESTTKNESNWLLKNQKDAYFIILSNNDEVSYPRGSFPGSEKYLSIQSWFNKISQVKSDPESIKFFPVVDYRVTKTKTSSDLYDRYHTLAKVSHGEIYDINSPLDVTLSSIGKNITSRYISNERIIKITDNHVANDSLELWLNRKKLDSSEWSYRGNQIHLKQKPSKDSYIQIKYKRI